MKSKILITLILLLLPALSFAQSEADYAVPLSKPGEPGSLKVNIIYGSIKITGYDGDDVIVNFQNEDDDKEKWKGDSERNGLRKIPNRSIGLEITEKNNAVRVSVSGVSRTVNLDIKVPKEFSLNVSTINNGVIEIENVIGSHEVSNINGDVSMVNISGDAIVNTVNGDMNIDFDNINSESPMSFSSVNGDIDLSLPEDSKFSVKIKTEWGEIFSDFDFEVRRDQKSPEATKRSGEFKLVIDKWVLGDINGGGPEYLFKSLHGDILIRKN